MRLLAVVVLLCACSSSPAQDSAEVAWRAQTAPGFWEHWGDGRGEIDSYALVQPRYGELREGRAVLVFVTETMADGPRVKSEGGHAVEYPVLKLNEVRDFTTGIYDYNVLTSSFLRLDGEGAWGVPVKTSFSMQEWCGHVYQQLIVRDGAMQRTSHSYFDGEADSEDTVAVPATAVLADALPILVRGLVGRPGDTVDMRVFDRSIDARFAHVPGVFRDGTLSWGATTSVTVPMGTFDVTPVTLTRPSASDATYWVEDAAPHRIIRWEWSTGETGELLASVREPYWQQHGNEDVSAREALRLTD